MRKRREPRRVLCRLRRELVIESPGKGDSFVAIEHVGARAHVASGLGKDLEGNPCAIHVGQATRADVGHLVRDIADHRRDIRACLVPFPRHSVAQGRRGKVLLQCYNAHPISRLITPYHRCGRTEIAMRELLPPLCGVAVLAALFVQNAPAQTYPSHPIQVIVPATSGGPADTAIRIIEPELSSVLGTPLVLVNRPGASGIVGMSSVATAAPNGYTIGAGVNSIFTVVHISGSTVPFTIDDFLPIGNYASDVSILAVHPDASWRNFEELIDYARNNPGKLSYASAGVGTVSSLSMQSIISASRLEITAVPFAGGAQATMAVIGHHVDLGMVPYSTAAQMLRERKLRPLMTTAPARLAPLPETPTLSEKGSPRKGSTWSLVFMLHSTLRRIRSTCS
jgi:tripartite-type tricarboxylate transporter receptor subunit TctC